MIFQVVVMTHAYGNRSGVRYMTGGLKVYYVPWRPFVMQNTLPTVYGTLPIVRTILVREKISLVHGHQAFSTLCHEALMHARTMGYKVVFTDHSLYGFADIGSIHMNKVLQFTLADVSQAICVSHTSKENTVLRSGLPPEKVFMIPNAVDTAMFKPAPERLGNDEIIIVVISRLVYRKGADLLVEVIPEICRLYPNVSLVHNSWIYLFLCSYAYAALELLYQMDSHIQMLQTTISRHRFMGFPPLFKFFLQHLLPQM
jgi:phosphatidylinositol glycan class A protein